MTRYIDPNSGAAPQPGGYAGAHGAEFGHAIPADGYPEGVEQQRPLNEAPENEGTEDLTVEELAKQREDAADATDKTDEERQLLEAQANPRKVLNDLDENSTESDEDGYSEEEAVDAKALETQAVNVNENADSGAEADAEAYDPSAHNTAEVLAYAKANPDRKDAILAAEKAGQNRKGITTALSE